MCRSVYCLCVMCTVLLPPDVHPIAVNKMYHISYHIILRTENVVKQNISLSLYIEVRKWDNAFVHAGKEHVAYKVSENMTDIIYIYVCMYNLSYILGSQSTATEDSILLECYALFARTHLPKYLRYFHCAL
jgi:hypothetical protein